MKVKRLKYINRSLVFSPYYALCFSERKYLKEMKRLGVEDAPPFVAFDAGATTHIFTRNGEFPTCIVCMVYKEKWRHSTVVGILAHEASHIVDEAMSYLRESKPSSEFKAYALQNITQNLHIAYKKYAKKMKRKKK